MNLNPSGFKSNSVLTEEEAKAVDTTLHFSARKLENARQWVPVTSIASSAEYVQYDTATDMGSASWSFSYAGAGNDLVDITKANLPLVYIKKGFTMPEGKNMAALSRNSQNAVIQVKGLEDRMIATRLYGSSAETSAAVQGLYDFAGNDEATANAFTGAASTIAAFTSGIALLRADNIHSDYFAAFNSVEYGLMTGGIATGGVEVFKFVSSLLGGNGHPTDPAQSKIFLNDNLTAGSGMIWSRNPMFMTYYVAREPWEKSIANIEGSDHRICMISRLAVTDTNAICRLSDIS